MLFSTPLPEPSPLRAAVRAAIRADEDEITRAIAADAEFDAAARARIAEKARELVLAVRRDHHGHGGIDAFMHEFELSSREGVVLMCLAEALLRVPDAETVDLLIKDKLAAADWESHLGRSDSLFVNASTWALMLTGRVIQLEEASHEDLGGVLRRLVQRSGEPVIRAAVTRAMRILGRQFVMGRTIEEALSRAEADEKKGYRHSYDMLGEAARTMADAERYFAAYRQAIKAIGTAAAGRGPIAASGISVKLSALHPRYEFAQRERVLAELLPKLKALALDAARYDIGLTVDAEESDRLDISLDVIDALSGDAELGGWQGFGLAVQAYLKRAPQVIDWLGELAARDKRRLMVRLVKGAYWDSEIKLAQERGLDGYPVFTRKVSSDVCYMACVKRLFAAPERFYPQFASHNAHTVATVLEAAGAAEFEFQRLHGMGEALYAQLVGRDAFGRAGGYPCRLYAPVGSHEDLLAYLVRRLLENGSNTSFVNRIQDKEAPIEEIIADPVAKLRSHAQARHPGISLPRDLFGDERRNSAGVDLADPATLAPLARALAAAAEKSWRAAPIIAGTAGTGEGRPVPDPADRRRAAGSVIEAGAVEVEQALACAHGAAPAWDATPAEARAAALERFADLMERHRAELMALCVREAGKTVPDALSEVREAVDFCRYYAHRARLDFARPEALPGPTGERNQIALAGRGVFVCISPWNFPLAIFTGQVTAALAAGNAVIAKPAEQTPLIAARAVSLMHEAGVPGEVVQLLPGDGPTVGGPLVADTRVAGVAFTGSTETARLINQTLARRDGPIVPLIAETGGQNAMIVDSTALPEQVARDVLASAFQSAGQRCSALRVLFVQADVAERIMAMVAGAMDELSVGDPALLSTDVGPVIDEEARAMLEGHAKAMTNDARLVRQLALPDGTQHGCFFAPAMFEIDSLSRLQREVFGPILHVVRFAGDRLDQAVDAINGTGYGLTLGIHSRIDTTIERIAARARVGNVYVNRNMIGAVVGVQPFGGEGLSGTGPKAGGPRTLYRYATERALAWDVTAAGGNASLMSLQDER